MIVIFKILFIIFALSNIFGVAQKMKKGKIGKRGSIFWIVFWIMVITVVLDPVLVQWLADMLGIGRGSDLVLYMSVALLFALLFQLHLKIENIQKDVTHIVRKNALEDNEENQDIHK